MALMTHSPCEVLVGLTLILNMPCQRQIQSTNCIDVQQGCVVAQVLGLQTLRFFSKLMPLLLNWCQEPDLATQLKALEVLQEVVRHTWPRMQAHASFLWSQLHVIQKQLQANTAFDHFDFDGSHHDALQNGMQMQLASIAKMLYLCGGSCFQSALRDACCESDSVKADVMLHAVAGLV